MLALPESPSLIFNHGIHFIWEIKVIIMCMWMIFLLKNVDHCLDKQVNSMHVILILKRNRPNGNYGCGKIRGERKMVGPKDNIY